MVLFTGGIRNEGEGQPVMQVNLRREERRRSRATYAISWQEAGGNARALEVQGLDLSSFGLAIVCPEPLPVGTSIYIEAQDGHLTLYGTVKHCQLRSSGYVTGLEFKEPAKQVSPTAPSDHYEFLQISPKAEPATIHRVYRFMASRFHPDNPETGDPEKFLLLKHAYEVLSDPQRRAEYDASRQPASDARHNAIFDSSAFVNGIEGEMNRRLGVLSVLYNRRRASAEHPNVSLIELERTMGFPREYLDFTTWYLKSKGYIIIADNSDFSLTAAGVDYVEENAPRNPILKKLLNSGPRTATSNGHAEEARPARVYVLSPAETAGPQ